jgi:CspA family cold shock protein
MGDMAGHDATGIVDFFNDTGGYGFIETDAVEEDVFFHMEDVGGPDLAEGTEVAFDIEQAQKGPRAKNLKRLKSSDTAAGTTNHRRDAIGTVDFFNDTGRYGFIQTDAVEEDVFFHMEDVGGPDLVEGTEVAFDIEQRAKGPVATKIVRNPVDVTITGTDNTADSANNTEVYPDDTEQSSGTDTKIYAADDTQSAETDTEIASDSGSSASTTATTNISFCPSCGTALDDHVDPNFCPDCGTEL